MKRSRITLESIADFDNVLEGAMAAAAAKRQRREVSTFFSSLERNVALLRRHILCLDVPIGPFRQFRIFDPKERTISAPGFEDRVVHHSLINRIGPVIDNKMVADSYACRRGKGCHAAIRRVHRNMRRFSWYVKIDIKHYFASVDHAVLADLLRRTFKGAECIHLMQRIINHFHTAPGKGLPIGALTSQYFANFYLDRLDRYISALPDVRAMVRYMDDIVWWCDTRDDAAGQLAKVKCFARDKLLLSVKRNATVRKCTTGIPFCGMLIFPGAIRLGRRRRRRYATRRRYWERRWLRGRVSGTKLQSAWCAVKEIATPARAETWRANQLRIVPPPDA